MVNERNGIKVINHATAREFLERARAALYRNEVENNLIIGICNDLIANPGDSPYDAVFANALHGEQVLASSIKTISKAIVVCFGDNLDGVVQLAAHYSTNGIRLSGVLGECRAAEAFAASYGRPVTERFPQFIYTLESVRDIPLSEGSIELASIDDITEIERLVDGFYRETKLIARRVIDVLVQSRRFFVWRHRGEMVCIAAIIRQTEQAGIIGLVYTPPALRGNGYATSCVKRVSEIILERGARYCGLFTDGNNSTSNRIYQAIGYQKIADYLDMVFET